VRDMRSSYLVITTLTVLAVLFVASSIDVNAGSYSFAANGSRQKSLALTIQEGGITNAGPQKWTMSGGNLITALDTSPDLAAATWTTVHYSMAANVNGLSALGNFSLHLTGTAGDNTIKVGIHTTISGAIPAVCFQSYSISGTCVSGDTSEIPAYFIANGYMRVHETGDAVTKTPITLMIEDAALNPFGGPIVISSADGSLLVVATYDHARTVWQGVQTGGSLTGTIGLTPVSGSFVQTIHTDEDYVSGTATDSGQISLVGMSPSSLDSNGQFHGTSTIPTTGTIDCSPMGLPKTCTETGYVSTGTFHLDPSGVSFTGNYNVQWPAPSIVFGGTITAQVPSSSD
jgi:hypothetical protein